MGWWSQGQEGHSFEGDGSLVWGDEPADIIGDALDKIDAAFMREFDRKPTLAEVLAGVKFSTTVRYQ